MNDPTDQGTNPRGTSLADQDEAQLGGSASVLVRQKRDHARLDRLLHELEGSGGAAQKRVLIRICRLVFPHAFAEEAVLWPVVRRVLPDGEALTLQVEKEHQEVNQLVLRLEGDDLSPSERGRVLGRLVEVLRQDVRDEEDTLLPDLQERLGAHRLRRLGIAWEAVRRTAPTRPHPVVSRRPPGNVVAALPLTLLDNLRDLFEVAACASPRVAPAMETFSRAVARAAVRTERLEIVRRGERPSTHVDDSAG
jgi:hypothetical protein